MVAANLPPQNERPDMHCNDATLRHLLDDTLPAVQQSIAEDHLASCSSCRAKLESLVGDPTLWSETRCVYAEPVAQDFAATETKSQPQPHDATMVWLRSITQPPHPESRSPESSRPEDPNCVGYIDRYRIDSVIGSGGMGVVVAGFDSQLGRRVAIKFLAPHLAGLAPARRRFTREARAAAAIVHPAIMPIYGVNETSHPPYLVMPLVGSVSQGRSLQDRIDNQGPLDLETALEIAAQVAEGLAAAHGRGVVHRDIKPGNILLEENSPRILISDFGLARAMDDATVTVSGMIAGTPQYMSPEQAAGDEVGAASDLFSLGSVLYAMLTGRPPFIAESPIAVLRKVIDTPVKLASARVESLPPWVDRLLEQLLAKNSEQRIASAEQAAKLLRAAEAHVRHPAAHPLPASVQVASRSGNRPAMMACAAIALLIGIALPYLPAREAPSNETSRSASGSIASDSVQVSAVVSPDATPTPQTNPATVDLSWEWSDFSITADSIRQEIQSIESNP